MTRVRTRPLTLGASTLGDREGGEQLADALLQSALGDIDTSCFYAEGRSEQLLGRAIARHGGIPAGKSVFSKTLRDAAAPPFSADDVRRSIELSLSRLGVDRLPLYSYHDPRETSLEEAMAPRGAVSALVALRDEGVVGAIGVAVGRTELVHDFVRTDVFDAVLTHNRFTLVDRAAAPVLESARERGMTTFNAAIFGGGILADASKSTYGYRTPSAEFVAHLRRVRALARDFGVELASAALQFSLGSPLVDSTVVGVSSLARLDQLAGLAITRVPQDFFAAVDALGSPPPSPND
jgi:D-threo-aldose 1-dehydrogenase